MALLVGGHLSLVKAEESSILDGATVPTAIRSMTPDGSVLINGSFKTEVWTEDGFNPVDFTIALS